MDLSEIEAGQILASMSMPPPPSKVYSEEVILELYLDDVRRNPMLLNLIPLRFRSYKICLTAVRQYGLSFMYVPPFHRTCEMCLAAIRQSPVVINIMPFEIISTPFGSMLCREAVRLCPEALLLIPSYIWKAPLHPSFVVSKDWNHNRAFLDTNLKTLWL